ncbi:GNAT family N-acetyltransferase [Rhizobiales bacterium]|uniref:GNAT family N-acetyltransferase n=1 Tax=Hongsoonwoonella zoysiae TaxID=2821844 RepID=UPI0015600F54|nr:GNAT family N-acetyltransferase [Hongsoonwoonella zoysiae]NRG16422.1 GNAT family N-acetyltransferase [Hongsoonwoonella zoysiae]
MTDNLKTARLTLRTPCDHDIDRVVEFAGDFEVSKMLAVVPHPYERRNAIEWLEHIRATDGKDEQTFAIDDGSGLIGAISFRKLRETPRIGYWLGRPFWGRGYMSEAAHAALTWLFSTFDAHGVEAEAMAENPTSIAVLRKLGFEETASGNCASQARGEAMPSLVLRLERNTFLTTTQHAAEQEAEKELVE